MQKSVKNYALTFYEVNGESHTVSEFPLPSDYSAIKFANRTAEIIASDPSETEVTHLSIEIDNGKNVYMVKVG